MRSLFIFVIFSTFILTGCETKPHKSQAILEQENIKLRLSDSLQKGDRCIDELNADPKYKIIQNEILAAGSNNPHKFDLMASDKLLTIEQKEIFKSYLYDSVKCRQIYLMGLSGLPFYSVIFERNNLLDNLYFRLLSDQINIGQMNQGFTEINNNGKANFIKAGIDLDNRLRNQHEREMSKIQQQAEIDKQRTIEWQRSINQQNQQILNKFKAPNKTDTACMMRCFDSGSLHEFCQKMCSY